ncbi:EAL domain-containing protein [Colwellia ponticola]|uniref:cyclic-guanylate-specific phosphodiesterase n=1 Tax=Colwellia ponticola TaxID=2304625 RepID=A0A8H2JML3_9GAMM|nr:EAL domain-containing protein [Colwellia ponticola]TMM46899.1 EAL domain-containing protein [Colwellia ponticola]
MSNQVLLQGQLDTDNNQQVLAIRKLLTQKLIRAEQLAQLEREIGYGGLIHYFKKYTLRGEATDRQTFINSLTITQDYIALLTNSSHFTPEDKQALATIKDYFTRYYQYMLLTDSLKNEGKNIEQIDSEYHIDDRQAIDAIKQLQRNELEIDADYWLELSSQRIDKFKALGHHIRTDIQALAQTKEQQAIESLRLFLAIFLLLFIFTVYFSFLSVQRFIKELRHIRDGMKQMQLKRNFNQPLMVQGNNEITDMVIAFNHILAEINQSEEDQKISAAVFHHASEAIMITNANNEIETVNPAFCRISGYSAADVIGKNPNILSSGKHGRSFYKKMWQDLEQKNCWQGEVWNKRKNGELFPEFLAISVVRDKSRKPLQYISLFSDITKYKKYEEDIWIQANYDSLTGLPNRDFFLDKLRKELTIIKENKKNDVVLLFIDLDRFKYVNDTWGHTSGDKLLKLAAKRLKMCVREKDTVARLGGDEFVVLLEGVLNRKVIEGLVHNMLTTLSMPFHLGSKNEAVLSASIGITVASEDGDNADLLFKNADTAMYQAKTLGRNTYQFFTKEMNETVSRRMYIEQALRQAIKQQEFVLHYQPVVSLSNGEIIGVEALIRWQHPNKGLIYPDNFITIAEETGLIEQIGQWVIEQACADLNHWQSLGLMLHVAVNVSSRQCKQTSQTPLKEVISNALLKHNIAPSNFKVEITESLLMDNSQEMITTLQEIRSLGVAIHMDDFGTGYSSLSYLKHFPINVLKIDRSFIQGAIDDKTDASLVEAVVLIGHSLSLKLVGEGIETQEHYNYLRELGCDYGQGYFISKPIIATELITLCQEVGDSPKWIA